MLEKLGSFTSAEIKLFNHNIERKFLNKNDILIREGEISKSIFYVVDGAIYQVKRNEEDEVIIDLNIKEEWIFNYDSLINQIPAETEIRCFQNAEVIELKLESLHKLIASSQNFLQINKIFNSLNTRLYFYDISSDPLSKYKYLLKSKPQIIQIFPLTMIASYLKIRPETLSRVRRSLIS